MSITNVSMVGALQTNRSDTLNGIYTRIKLTAENILRDLALFSANLEAMKTDSAKLTEFRTKAKNFSQNRDKLKQELTKLEQFKKQNEKALLRSGTRKEAKSEMADTIADFAQTFINVAQKAVTDFANMDGKLSIDEAKQTYDKKHNHNRNHNDGLPALFQHKPNQLPGSLALRQSKWIKLRIWDLQSNAH